MIAINTTWTPEEIKSLLNRSNKAVEHAILAIFDRQTSDEQDASDTRHRNGRGFASCHAYMGSYYARWIQSGKHLDGKHLDKARKMALCYSGQLAEVAASNVVAVEEVAHV